MATTLTYNGIRIENCLLRRFDEQAVYDESNTDIVAHKFRIRVSGFVYQVPSPTTQIIPGAYPPHVAPQKGTAVATFKHAKRMLMETRKDLALLFGGTQVLYAKPFSSASDVASGQGDVDNGPKPISCDIIKVVGNTSLRVDFEIETTVVDCETNKNSFGVLSNRWSVSDDIDERWFTTRTISGKLRVASQKLHRIGPHTFRSWCLPPIEDGFKRVSMNFMSTPDGLTLEYTIVDRMIAAACPLPGLKWSGTHVESTGDGIRTFAEINLRMEGPPKIRDKRDMIGVCARIALTKLQILGQEQGESFLIRNAAVVDHLDDSAVELRIEIERFPDEPTKTLNFDASTIGKWIGPLNVGGPYDLLLNPVPATFGEGDWKSILIAAMQSPCDNRHSMTKGTGTSERIEIKRPERQDTQIATYTGPEGTLAKDAEIISSISDSAKSSVYTYYRLSVRYKTQHHRVQLPIARSIKPNTGGNSVGSSTGNSSSSSSSSRAVAKIIDLAPPTSLAVVSVEAERVGRWPDLPKPADVERSLHGGGTWKLIGSEEIEPVAPQPGPDGSTRRAIHHTKTMYTYAMTEPLGKDLLIGKEPMFKDGRMSTTLQASVKKDNLFNPARSSSV